MNGIIYNSLQNIALVQDEHVHPKAYKYALLKYKASQILVDYDFLVFFLMYNKSIIKDRHEADHLDFQSILHLTVSIFIQVINLYLALVEYLEIS